MSTMTNANLKVRDEVNLISKKGMRQYGHVNEEEDNKKANERNRGNNNRKNTKESVEGMYRRRYEEVETMR